MHDQNSARVAERQEAERAAAFRRQSEYVNEVFTYHPPGPGQPERYEAIRRAARELAHVILGNTPPSADQSAALRKLREAVMTANAAIALEGVPHA